MLKNLVDEELEDANKLIGNNNFIRENLLKRF